MAGGGAGRGGLLVIKPCDEHQPHTEADIPRAVSPGANSLGMKEHKEEAPSERAASGAAGGTEAEQRPAWEGRGRQLDTRPPARKAKASLRL